VRAAAEATDDLMLADFCTEEFSRLDDPEVKKWLLARVERACRENDLKFFIRLGRAVSRRRPTQFSKLDRLLVAAWIGSGERPGLCCFTDEALTELCRVVLGNRALSLNAVRKTRWRLGLKQAGMPWIRRVKEVRGKLVVG
jgi:hypothetical protein